MTKSAISMNPRPEAPHPTYFEVRINNELQRFTASECLPGRKEILRFCTSHGIPVTDENQIVTFHVRPRVHMGREETGDTPY